MKKQILILFMTCVLFITGCTTSANQKTKVPEETTESEEKLYDFDIRNQTSSLGVNMTDKNFPEMLSDSSFYVEHDGYYYPLVTYVSKDTDATDLENAANYDDMYFFTSENELNIPTLFEGDRLVYYSKTNMLNYILFYRLQDCDYTIGVTNLLSNIGGRYYIDFTDTKAEEYLLPNSGLEDIYNQTEADAILFDKIAGTQITDEIVDNGVLRGLEKDKNYDLEVYFGTYFKHYTTQSKYHLFRGFEKFASINYTTMQDYLYEVEIPEYLTTGYYSLNGKGIFRYVKGSYYNSDTNYNEPLLILAELDEYGNEIPQTKWTYSETPALNQYKTTVEGTLGYINPDEQAYLDSLEEGENNPNVLRQSVIKEYELWLPANKICTIKVRSKSGEKTGNIELASESIEKTADYNYLEKIYTLEVNGRGEKATLTINGFFQGYEIELIEAEIYNNQDIQVEEYPDPPSEKESNSTSGKKPSIIEQIKEGIANVLRING